MLFSMQNNRGMQFVRGVMERSLNERVASAVIFEALSLDRVNALPADDEALRRFVEGPLRNAALRRLGPEKTEDVLRSILQELSRGPVSEPPRAAGLTLEVPVVLGPVRVIVVSGGSTLAVALRAALGGERLGVRTVSDAATMGAFVRKVRPELVVVDGTDPIHGSMEQLAEAFGDLSSTAMSLVWGHEQPFGSQVARELEQRKIPFTSIDRQEGVDPLLDFVRSRFS